MSDVTPVGYGKRKFDAENHRELVKVIHRMINLWFEGESDIPPTVEGIAEAIILSDWLYQYTCQQTIK